MAGLIGSNFEQIVEANLMSENGGWVDHSNSLQEQFRQNRRPGQKAPLVPVTEFMTCRPGMLRRLYRFANPTASRCKSAENRSPTRAETSCRQAFIRLAATGKYKTMKNNISIFVFCTFLSAAALLWTIPALAEGLDGFDDGERFTYQVSWGAFSNAGRIVVAADKEATEGKNLMRLTVNMKTRGLVSLFYSPKNSRVALIDTRTGRALRLQETGHDGRRQLDNQTDFDYVTRRAVYVDRVRPQRSRTVEFPEGKNPIDLILGLIQTRQWNLQSGEERDLLVYASRDIYPLIVRAEGYEEVHTPLGSFQTRLLVPRMSEPKGIFEKGGEVKVWIAEGDNPLPVRMQVHLSFGVATMTLVSHDPGRAALAPTGSTVSFH
jgi:hypothetical protein